MLLNKNNTKTEIKFDNFNEWYQDTVIQDITEL